MILLVCHASGVGQIDPLLHVGVFRVGMCDLVTLTASLNVSSSLLQLPTNGLCAKTHFHIEKYVGLNGINFSHSMRKYQVFFCFIIFGSLRYP